MQPSGYSISSELISAISALNTEVTYQGPLRTGDEDIIFISDVEPLVSHAIEHIQSALQTRPLNELSTLRRLIYKLAKNNTATWEKADKLLRSIESKL